MKVTAYEMTKAMPEDRNYYSDYDPMAEGYVSKDNLHSSATYTLSKSKGYFKIYFNKPFTKMGYIMTTMVHTSCRTTRSIQNTSRAIMSS